MLQSFVQADRAQMACSSPILPRAWVTTSPTPTPSSNTTPFSLTGKNPAQMKKQLQSGWLLGATHVKPWLAAMNTTALKRVTRQDDQSQGWAMSSTVGVLSAPSAKVAMEMCFWSISLGPGLEHSGRELLRKSAE